MKQRILLAPIKSPTSTHVNNVNSQSISAQKPPHFFILILLILSQLIHTSQCFRPSLSKELKPLPDDDFRVSYIKDLILKKYGAALFNPNLQNFNHLMLMDKFVYVTASSVYVNKLSHDDLLILQQHKLEVNSEAQRLCQREPENVCQTWKAIKYLDRAPFNEHQDYKTIFYCYAFNRIYLGQLASEKQGRSGCTVLSPFNKPIGHWQVNLFVSADTSHRSVVHPSRDGYLYIGSFHSDSLKITRIKYDIPSGRPDYTDILVTRSTVSYISEPAEFIYSFETKYTVYFLLVENSIESYRICNKQRKTATRLVRVCKNDPGGAPQIQAENNLATVAKADLECSISRYNEFLYRYSEIKTAYWDDRNELLYVVFSSNSNGPHGSALCVYSLASIEKSFAGPWRATLGFDEHYLPKSMKNKFPNLCEDLNTKRTVDLKDVQVDSMLYLYRINPILPISNKPLLKFHGEVWHQIVMKEIKLSNSGRSVWIMLLASDDRVIKLAKYSPDQICQIEDIRLINQKEASNEKILVMKLDNKTSEIPSFYLGTTKQVIRLPLAICSKHSTRKACLQSRDPFCGWDVYLLKCLPFTESGPNWEQDIGEGRCPESEQPDETASTESESNAWSKWSTCSVINHLNENSYVSKCLCRYCLSQNLCNGRTNEVTNCTINGGWSMWSEWSQCSEKCGSSGTQVRQRTCNSPKPMAGGQSCPGVNSEKRLCEPQPPPCSVNEWSSWSKWTECSSMCGSGYSTRSRQCLNEDQCLGSDKQFRECYKQCSKRKLSDWTEWLSNGLNSRTQKRFRFVCSVNSSVLMNAPQILIEEKDCSSPNNCKTNIQSPRNEGSWSSWSDWSQCSETCGSGGSQRRFRTCQDRYRDLSCNGDGEEVRACENSLPACPEMLTMYGPCWSEWSHCSATCGDGLKERKLLCSDSTRCTHNTIERRTCQEKPCSELEGELRWRPWSEWSKCNEDNHQFRTRGCKAEHLCIGRSVEYKSCLTDQLLLTAGSSNFSILHLVYTGVGGTLFGALIAAIVGFILWKRNVKKEMAFWRRRSNLNSPRDSSDDNFRKHSHKKAREALGNDSISGGGFYSYSSGGSRPLLRSMSTTDSGVNVYNSSAQSRDIHHLNNLAEHFCLNNKVPQRKYSLDGLDESCSVFSDSTNNAHSSVFSNSQNNARIDYPNWSDYLNQCASLNIGKETELTSMPSTHLTQYNDIRDLTPNRTRQNNLTSFSVGHNEGAGDRAAEGEAPFIPSRMEGSLSKQALLKMKPSKNGPAPVDL